MQHTTIPVAMPPLPRCQIGTSRLTFRGPARRIEGDFIAFLGGNGFYGHGLTRPLPDIVERRLGVPCLNMGTPHGGPDAFLKDSSACDIAQMARLRVIEVMPPQNMSNAFYTVHPRRNDRFLRVMPPLAALYPDVDFTDFSFTGHLLAGLRAAGEARFAQLWEGVCTEWAARFADLVAAFEGPTLIVSLEHHTQVPSGQSADAPAAPCAALEAHGLDVLSLMAPKPRRAARADGAVLHRVWTDQLMAPLCRALNAERPATGAGLDLALGQDGPVRRPGAPAGALAQSFSINSGTAVNRSATSP